MTTRRFTRTSQPQGPVALNLSIGLSPIAVFSGANGLFEIVDGQPLTRSSASSFVVSKAGIAAKQIAVNTGLYKTLPHLPTTIGFSALWSGVFVGAPTGSTAKLVGISGTGTSQSADIISIEYGATSNDIVVNAKIGSSYFNRSFAAGASGWYGKSVTLVGSIDAEESLVKLAVCVDGATTLYTSSFTGSGVVNILGTERFCVGPDIVEIPTRHPNVNCALAAVFVGVAKTPILLSLASNPWQIFAPITRQIFVGAGAAGGTTSATIAQADAADTQAISAEVTTGAAIAGTDGADTQAITAANWTKGQIVQTDGADVQAINASVTTGAAIAVTDGADTQAVTGDVAGTTSASVAQVDGADTTAVTAIVTTGAGIAQVDAPDVQAVATSGTGSAEASGGYWYQGPDHRKQRKKQRKELGIAKADISNAIAKVARAVVADTGTNDAVEHYQDHKAQFVAMLVDELRGYEMPNMEQAITRQIQIAIAAQEQEHEDEMILMLI